MQKLYNRQSKIFLNPKSLELQMFRYSINLWNPTALQNPSDGLPFFFVFQNKNCMFQIVSHIRYINTKYWSTREKFRKERKKKKETLSMRNPKPYQTQILYNILPSSHLTLSSFPSYSTMPWSNRCSHDVSCWHLCFCFVLANCIFSPVSRKCVGSTRTTQKTKQKNQQKRDFGYTSLGNRI